MRFEIYLYLPDKMPGFYKKAIAEYEKRLSRYGKIRLHLIKKEKEWKKTLVEVDSGYYLLTGSSLSSEELSKKISHWESERRKDVSFYIDHEYKTDVLNEKLEAFSVSDFQINGAMTAMILYEQIYRGYRIMHNHPYHK